MKSVCRCVLTTYRTMIINSSKNFSSESKTFEETLHKLKPHARSGVLGAVNKSETGFPAYVILKETSPILSQAIMEVKNRKTRQKKASILLEGKRLIQDALNIGVKPKKIFFSQKRVLESLYLPNNLRELSVIDTIFYQTPYKMMQLFSNTETSQGIMGIFEMPMFEMPTSKNLFPITVICDNIREPGNLGSILRTVTAVGVSKIILTKGCTDMWGDKVLRSACGAHFRIDISSDVSWSSLENLKGHVCVADNNNLSTKYDTNKSEVKVFSKTINTQLAIIPYHDVDYCKGTPLILIIGGETHGISDEAYKFAENRKGIRVYIPLLNEVESLNSATTVGILCFEARRQILNSSNIDSQNSLVLNN
ncbi:rRNA methyltransferase 3, mitochondrial [Daktulosphaira vitifoliae]|uniref:rRNA methyltransferase 3, mitochondrial n=1 Tax=Daktulosphaira vitifoliae TaxID=58002 RepID=UPI0021AA135B|nr:rRNA methyltransferase 3, mitochondrial [Daktulosphaira vitifoliae]